MLVCNPISDIVEHMEATPLAVSVHSLLHSLELTVFYTSASHPFRSKMKSFTSIIVFSAALAGFAAAKAAVETRDSCKSTQFWYAKLGCCLDHGGPSTPPTPPSSRDCPKDNWYWNTKQGCCTPRHENPPEPSCKGGYSWSKGSCADTYEDLNNCGGCTSLKEGQDCGAIAHSWNVGCEAGACKIYNCAPGYEVSFDGKTCIKL
ncbi:unnamed protein product [Rhizoctonia solani]|uniref:Protein CPL1-like domain-containing protein n=1 Tax=Rhizoctonia solani TaxID=456999 RepID=A0A8H3CD26_9AGAM|nr:unnamed protein product [Rhizoctonia solani]